MEHWKHLWSRRLDNGSFYFFFLFLLFLIFQVYLVLWNKQVCLGRYGFPLFTRDLRVLDTSTGGGSQYSVLLWKTANPFIWTEHIFIWKPLILLPDGASHEYTFCTLQFVHEVANTDDPWLATERYNMSVLLIFFMTSMLIAATFLMFCSESVLYLPGCGSIMISLLKKLV